MMNLGKKGTQIHGIPVAGNINELKQGNLLLMIEEIIIAQPGLSAARITEILNLLERKNQMSYDTESQSNWLVGKS